MMSMLPVTILFTKNINLPDCGGDENRFYSSSCATSSFSPPRFPLVVHSRPLADFPISLFAHLLFLSLNSLVCTLLWCFILPSCFVLWLIKDQFEIFLCCIVFPLCNVFHSVPVWGIFILDLALQLFIPLVSSRSG